MVALSYLLLITLLPPSYTYLTAADGGVLGKYVSRSLPFSNALALSISFPPFFQQQQLRLSPRPTPVSSSPSSFSAFLHLQHNTRQIKPAHCFTHELKWVNMAEDRMQMNLSNGDPPAECVICVRVLHVYVCACLVCA